jgi:hypothetical protein
MLAVIPSLENLADSYLIFGSDLPWLLKLGLILKRVYVVLR